MYSLDPAALLLVMAVVFAESGLLIGYILPGDPFLLFLAGAPVASHVIGLPIWVLVSGVFVAAMPGDQTGYMIGRRYGPRLFSRLASGCSFRPTPTGRTPSSRPTAPRR